MESPTPQVAGSSSEATPAKPAPDAGFTLIEVLVALGVLSLGIASAIALFAAATASHKRAIHRTNAAAMAEQALSDVETALATGAEAMQLQEAPPFEGIRQDFPGYNISLRFLVGVEGADEILAEVTIGWVVGGRDRTEVFRQWMTREDRVHSRRYIEVEAEE